MKISISRQTGEHDGCGDDSVSLNFYVGGGNTVSLDLDGDWEYDELSIDSICVSCSGPKIDGYEKGAMGNDDHLITRVLVEKLITLLVIDGVN